MILDGLLAFVPINTPLSCVGANGATFYSNTVDLLGVGPGIAPPAIIGNVTTWGADMGIGDNKVLIECAVGTAFTTSNSATLEVAFQGAPDTGSSGSYQPGTWQTYMQTALMTAAQLAAQTTIARFDFPPAFPANNRPRFLRLAFITPSGTAFTAGTVAWALPTMARDDYAIKYQPNNYVVA